MKAIMVMFDSLNRRYLEPYGAVQTITPNFKRLAERTVQFDNHYTGSLPCMPARREMHTGRYNFLHRSWGPIEPYDDSVPEILKKNGIHSHLVSDHQHYWEDGGATYHTRYKTWENIRGQEGDFWKGYAGPVSDDDENLIHFTGMRGELYRQDLINRSYVRCIHDHPQTKTFNAGLEFIETNHSFDNWFLQIECFDPHEPFFSDEKYHQLYPHNYDGLRFDWPDYAAVTQTPEEVEEARYNYKALVSMCDESLGRVLDMMDKYDLWKDTLLIVNTDHGYILGEHCYWAKNYMPFYEEIVNIPLFIWDPVSRLQGIRKKQLVQTIDIAASLLDFFQIEKPSDMQGESILKVIRNDEEIRRSALFGIHGGHVCCTDGRYVLMKAPVSPENQPLFEYTLSPAHSTSFFNRFELENAALSAPFSFTKNYPLLKCPTECGIHAYDFGDLLFDLENDYAQEHPLDAPALFDKMCRLMVSMMKDNDAPKEQYARLGLEKYL